jgi:hypothetical protein
MHRSLLSAEAMEIDSDHASPYALQQGRAKKIPMLKRLGAIAPAGAVQSTLRDLARWLTFQGTRSPRLLGERMWRELHRPQARMPASEEPEVQERYYALGWIHERYRGHPIVVHNGAIDGFTVHLGFLPETGQGLILLMNLEDATEAQMALAYSAYDRLLGVRPIDWEARLRKTPTRLQSVREVALDLPIEEVVGRYEHPGYGVITVQPEEGKLAMRFRTFHSRLAYQGKRRFVSVEPIADGSPRLSIQFSKQETHEPLKLFVPLNFDEGDPVEVFTRAR